MRNFISHKSEKGVSLVEVLATIIILVIVSTILFSVISNGQTQYKNQSDKNQGLSNVSYVLKVLTKEIRKNPNSVSVNTDNNILTIGGVDYKLIDDKIIQESTNNQTVLIDGIKTFEVNFQDGYIEIKIEDHQNELTSTKIVVRS